MEKLQQQQSDIENQLADSDIYAESNKDKLKQLLLEKSQVDEALENVEMEWLEASEAYEEAMGEG